MRLHRAAGAAIVAAVASTLTLVAVPAGAATDPAVRLAPGVTYRTLTVSGAAGPSAAYEVTVNVADRHVGVDLLHPPTISTAETVSAMADTEHALAGVNGDFFNISETHAGVAATDSSDGPEITQGFPLKGYVPDAQRFGPALPEGTSARDVLGVGTDHRARLGTLTLRGQAVVAGTTIPIAGANQYAMPEGGITEFTRTWGSTSRERVVCGDDTDRDAPCSTDTAEVTIARGVVTAVGDTVGTGPIPGGTVVLVGREHGADVLRGLQVGQRARVTFGLDCGCATPFTFAVGGFPIVRGGQALPDLDTAETAPRTAAGISADGRTLFLLVVDGRSEVSGGLTVEELAAQLIALGATDGVNLDGGGSSTLVSRSVGQRHVVVDNVPSDGTERAVANGVGVFVRP